MRTLLHHDLNSGSIADIAFLLLTFFMVTTQMQDEKGLTLVLPRSIELPPAPVNKRNIFSIQINSKDQFMVNGELKGSLFGLKNDIKSFVMNHGFNPDLSESPEKAVISLKTDRGATHKAFITVLDEIQAAYYEMHAVQAGIEVERYRRLNLSNPDERQLYEKGKRGLPMNISIVDIGRY